MNSERRMILKLCGGTSPLQVEMGRWRGVKREQRTIHDIDVTHIMTLLQNARIMRIMFLANFEDERLISFRYNIIMKFTLQCHYVIIIQHQAPGRQHPSCSSPSAMRSFGLIKVSVVWRRKETSTPSRVRMQHTASDNPRT